MNLTLTGLQQLVHFTFILTCFGMAGASLFFGLLSTRARGEWSTVLIIESVICAIAALNYVFMKDIYAGLYSGIAATTGHRFPTEFRYIDWTLTVPLITAQFPAVLGLGRRGLTFMGLLVIMTLTMLVTGFFAEILTTPALHWGLFGASCIAWIAIIAALGYGLRELPENMDQDKAAVVRRLALFVLVGWAIYPIGFLLPTFGIAGDYRELAYNFADLVNKVGVGVSVSVAALAVMRREESSYYDDDEYQAVDVA